MHGKNNSDFLLFPRKKTLKYAREFTLRSHVDTKHVHHLAHIFDAPCRQEEPKKKILDQLMAKHFWGELNKKKRKYFMVS